jgi:hypothetical protein
MSLLHCENTNRLFTYNTLSRLVAKSTKGTMLWKHIIYSFEIRLYTIYHMSEIDFLTFTWNTIGGCVLASVSVVCVCAFALCVDVCDS